MQPQILFMCEVADADAKERMAQYVNVVEIDDTTGKRPRSALTLEPARTMSES